MNFNKHSKLEGQHAFLGASKYHWINYDADKIVDSWKKYQVGKRCCGSHQKTEGFGTDSRNNNSIVRHDYTEGCQMQNHQGVAS